MVGDVKQSIYRFRLARPDLFNDKSEKYQDGNGGELINLNMNYRSRSQVLDATNYLFRTLMTKEFGGIEYSSDVELHVPDESAYNNNFPSFPDGLKQDNKTELIQIDFTRDDEREKENNTRNYTNYEIEAVEIGKKIKELVEGNPEENKDKFYIVNEHFDSKKPESERNKRYRPVGYGDIVILQRRVKGMTRMVRIYEQMGIPVMLEDSSGYFDAMEISTMISVLRIIDNVQQDIPFASVLLSHIGGLSDSDLARIESLSVDRRMSLADKCKLYEEGYLNAEEPELRGIAEKLHRLSEMTERWRNLRPYISIAELIDRILQDTNYETFVAAMPEGERRLGNLKIFRVRAEKFESVRNAGLLDYLKYIDKCRLHDIDYSEAKVNVEAGNAVRIMSIHKSKGLEFPVVFVSATGGKFMLQDMSGSIAVDSDYKIAMDNFWYLENGIMVRTGNVKKDIMKVLNENAVKTEEARLLYVAMTRAKEKLIITGTFDKNPVPIVGLSKSLLDYVRYVIANQENKEIRVTEKTIYEIVEDFTKRYIKKSMDYTYDTERLLDMISEELKEDIISGTDNPYSFVYPYEFQTGAKAKMSVSEIKHQEMEDHMVIEDTSGVIETDGAVEEADDAEEREEARRKAAMRGTIIHYLFEKLDYSKVDSKEDLKKQFEDILEASIYSEEEKSLVNTMYLTRFYSEEDDSIFMRMKKSFMNNQLFREKQFIAGLGLDEIPGYDISELEQSSDEDYTVIQGIIDAYFYQDDGSIVLVDYKTDNVEEPKELIERYGAQMYLYALTLEKLTSRRVDDVVLYSTRHGEVHYTAWREYKNKS